jgi:hypothetical protein
MTGIRLAALDRAALVAEKRLDVLVDFSAGHDRLQASCPQSRLALSRKNLDTTPRLPYRAEARSMELQRHPLGSFRGMGTVPMFDDISSCAKPNTIMFAGVIEKFD